MSKQCDIVRDILPLYVDEEKAKGEKYKEMLEKVLENIKSMENM